MDKIEHSVVLYPLLFENNFHTVIWGGNRLKPMKNLASDDEPDGKGSSHFATFGLYSF